MYNSSINSLRKKHYPRNYYNAHGLNYTTMHDVTITSAFICNLILTVTLFSTTYIMGDSQDYSDTTLSIVAHCLQSADIVPLE